MYCISSAHLHSTVETACNCGPVAPRPAYADSECTGSPGRHSAQPDRADPPGLSLHQDVGHSPRHLIHLCATHSSAPLNRKERSDCLPTQHRLRPRTQPSPENVPVHHMPLDLHISYSNTTPNTYIAFLDHISHFALDISHSALAISYFQDCFSNFGFTEVVHVTCSRRVSGARNRLFGPERDGGGGWLAAVVLDLLGGRCLLYTSLPVDIRMSADRVDAWIYKATTQGISLTAPTTFQRQRNAQSARQYHDHDSSRDAHRRERSSATPG